MGLPFEMECHGGYGPVSLQGWKYYLVGEDDATARMMDNQLAYRVNGIRDANIVIFTGGTDISPTIYGEFGAHPKTQRPDKSRDRIEIAIAKAAMANKKCLVGICRGGQLLNCLNGGKLFQHVDNHGMGDHFTMYQAPSGKIVNIMTRGDHHQMMRPAREGAKIIGWAKRSTIRSTFQEDFVRGEEIDPEIIWYPSTRTLCFQPHPEWDCAPCEALFLECLSRVMIG